MIFQPPMPEEIGLIEGQTPDSKEEWWVALALWKYDIHFEYQFQIFGGTSRRGGLIVDFLVFIPMGTPLLVHGNYWHKDELTGGDTQDYLAIMDYFKQEPIILWGSDAQSKEDVEEFVKREVLI